MSIPEDILVEAEKLAAEWEMEPGAHRMLKACFSSAIMEERQRCAAVAREYGKACGTDMHTRRAAQFIAEAIEA